MRRKPVELAVSLIIIIFLPVALLGLIASVNEYRDQGISGVVDCNGPLTVMLFIVPSLVVYAAGAVYYAVLVKGVKRSLPAAALLVLCAVMVYAAGGKVRAVYSEKNRPEHQENLRVRLVSTDGRVHRRRASQRHAPDPQTARLSSSISWAGG